MYNPWPRVAQKTFFLNVSKNNDFFYQFFSGSPPWPSYPFKSKILLFFSLYSSRNTRFVLMQIVACLTTHYKVQTELGSRRCKNRESNKISRRSRLPLFKTLRYEKFLTNKTRRRKKRKYIQKVGLYWTLLCGHIFRPFKNASFTHSNRR